MTSKSFNHFKHQLGLGAVNITALSYRAVLLMTNTTADTERNPTNVGSFTTLDEFNGSGYTAGGLPLTGVTWTKDAANDRSIFDADDPYWAALGAGSRSIAGCLIVIWQGSLAASNPVAWLDGPTFPYAANGNALRVIVPTSGIAHLGD